MEGRVGAKSRIIFIVNALLVFYIIMFCIFLVTGCSLFQDSKDNEGKRQYKIILLGKESYVYSDVGFIRGMEMGMDAMQSKEELVFEHVDDNGDYETGLLCGERLAKDDSVIAVFSFQDFDVLEALATVFEENKKPLFLVQGCYETTLEKGYEYIFSAFMSAKGMGTAISDYCKAMGIGKAACSHTDTTFEEEEMIGFASQSQKNNIIVIDMEQGPYTIGDLKRSYRIWETLGVEAVYLAHYTYSNTEWMLEMIGYLKSQNKDLHILSDYSLNNDATLKEFGDILEGVVIAAPYSIEINDAYKKLSEDYRKRYDADMSNVAVQGYDLYNMFALMVREGVTSPDKIIKRLKQREGYQGVTGKICFSKEGKLEGITPQYLQVKNGQFVTISLP